VSDPKPVGRPGGQPGPTGTPIDDESDRTDLDMDEPWEGFGERAGIGHEITGEEAREALSSDEAGGNVKPDERR
jgi:hypothetical protein